MTILKIFVYAFNRKKHAKSHLPSTFQTLDIELLSPKFENKYTVTKLPKPDHIYINCVYTH